jgi:phosphohistidine phosphatase
MLIRHAQSENYLLLRDKPRRVVAMTKQLILLRHGNATDADMHTDDHHRALSAQGVRECAAIVEVMKKRQYAIDIALVSSACRTQDTAKELAEVGGIAIEVLQHDDKLYLATPAETLAIIHSLPETCHTALVIGHNPGLCELVVWLAREVTSAFATSGMPTCALVELTFEQGMEWQHITPNSATLTDYAIPRSQE